jgi:hypothetical protein
LGILEPFKTEFYSLISKSIKNNIWKVDQNAKNTLEGFRQKIKLRTMTLADVDVFEFKTETTAILSM